MFRFIPLFFITLLMLVLYTVQPVLAENNSDEETASSSILISEVQTRTEESPYDEFVEIYNTTDDTIDIYEWELQYKPSDSGEWANKISASQPDGVVYEIQSGETYVLGTEKFTDNNPDIAINLKLNSGSAESGGHLRLVKPSIKEDETWQVIDLVGWGDAENIYEGSEPAPAPPKGGSIARCYKDDELVDTLDNFADFTVSGTPTPGEGIDCPEEDSEDELGDDNDNGEGGDNDENDDESFDEEEDSSGDDSSEEGTNDGETDDEDQDDANAAGCEGIVISEVLPNPEGPRSENPREDNAFVELYNAHPTDYIRLEGCGLQTKYESTDDESSVYDFEDIELAPGEYRVFHESETGVILPVSPSGTVYLLSATEEKLESVTYPQGMPEGASWAWFGEDEWAKTYETTPGDDNVELSTKPCPDGQERHPETNRCRNIADDNESDLVPCEPHQERNPETNRCRNKEQGNDFTPCESHQRRNPETNRCRNIASASNDLVPCESHQERNPETNRCRNVDSGRGLVPCKPHQERNPETNRCRNKDSAASSDLVPCEPHQERNPETNRCRNKVVDNERAIAGVRDVKTVATGAPTNWYFAGALLLLSLVYAGYEWRYDIRNFIARKKLSPR